MKKLYAVETNFLKTYISKPLDTHQYLRLSSCHVHHSKKSISFSQDLINVIKLSAGLKTEIAMKKLLDNKFWKQGNLLGNIY